MKIAVPKETWLGETRAAATPETVAKFVRIGAEVEVEAGVGVSAGFTDEAYVKAGAKIVTDRSRLLSEADIILRLRKPSVEEVVLLKRGAIHVSYLDPFNEKVLIEQLAERGITAFCMEFIPRTTRAQKMDALSSQANLAGYVAVILAAAHSNKVFPMMTTPAGTIAPAKVFVVGAGVAGLQAIATARRLGAKVTAYDTRPVVEEQVKSLGAQFLKIDLGETGQTKDGYAKPLTDEQIKIQREAMKKVCVESDVVITTAQVFGRRAPILITREMVEAMKPGSVVVDVAIESGGNVECAQPNQITEINGVKIIALFNLPGRVPYHATQVYANNLYNFVEEYWDKTNKRFILKLEDDIVKACLVTHEGKIVSDRLLEAYGQAKQ